jgi:phenylalanyl-tRNA synthetase alpha chain
VAVFRYRRDEIDRSHYPVFHQMEGVRLFTIPEVNKRTKATVFANQKRTPTAQEMHTEETAAVLAADLKCTLEGLVRVVGRALVGWALVLCEAT